MPQLRCLDRAPIRRCARRWLQRGSEHHRATAHDLRTVTPDQELPAVLGIVLDWRRVVPDLHLQRDLAAGGKRALDDCVRAAGRIGRQVTLNRDRCPQLPVDILMHLVTGANES